MKRKYGYYSFKARLYRAIIYIVVGVLWIGLILFVTGCYEFHATNIQFSKEARMKLDLGYTNFVDSLGVEYSFCCYGYPKGDTLYVQDVEIMWGFQTYNRVLMFPDLCSRPPIIYGHAHPRGHFNPSDIDLRALERSSYPAAVIISKLGNYMGVTYYTRKE